MKFDNTPLVKTGQQRTKGLVDYKIPLKRLLFKDLSRILSGQNAVPKAISDY